VIEKNEKEERASVKRIFVTFILWVPLARNYDRLEG